MRVERAADVLEGDAADLVREHARLRVQRLQPGVLHLVVAEHLLHQQERIGSHVELIAAVALRPLERREQRAVFGDVVGRDADRLRELLDQRAVGLLDADAEAGRAGIAARAAVDVGDDAIRGAAVGEGERRRGPRRPALSLVEGSRRGLPRRIGRRGRGRGRHRHVVENPVAVVALQDRIVSQDGVEDLRPQADVADGADAAARLGHRHAVALARDRLEGGRARSCRARATSVARSAAICSSDACISMCAALPVLRSASTALVSAASCASAALSAAARSSASIIRSSIVSSIFLISVWAKAISCWMAWNSWLVLTAIALLAELRQAALLHRDVLFERGARVLVGGDLLLRGGDVLARGFEPRLERSSCSGSAASFLPRRVGGAIELLQGDESFQVGVHEFL